MVPQYTINKKFYISLFILLFIIANYSFATNLYFSTSTGDDSRNFIQAKNPQTPWKTLTKLNEVFGSLRPGDTVYLKRNEVFYGTIQLRASGSSQNPIVISAYGKGKDPVISGWTPLEAWQPVGEGIYKAPADYLPFKANILMVNDQPQEIGRYPNEGYIEYKSGEVNNSLEAQKALPLMDFSDAMVVIRKNQWVIDRHRVSLIEGNTIHFSGEDKNKLPDDYGFFFQDHLQTLDKFGEWFHNTVSNEIYLFFGDSIPSNFQVNVSAIDHLITNVPNVKYIVLENLCFSGANSTGIELIEGEAIQLKQCSIEYSGENALTAISVPELTVVDNYIHYAQNNGLFLRYGTPNAIIKMNVIEKIHPFAGMGSNGDGNGVGIYSLSDDGIVEKNKLTEIGYSAIVFSGNRTLIKNNFINSYCLVKNDGGGIYTYEGSANKEFFDRKILGNIIMNGLGNIVGAGTTSKFVKLQVEGIYLDDNASGIEVTGNTVANVRRNGINLHNARNITIKENTIINAQNQLSMSHDQLGESLQNIEVVGNLFYATEETQKIYAFSSIKNAWADLVYFNNNVYIYPESNEFVFQVKHRVNEDNIVQKSYNATQWYNGPFKDKSFKPIIINKPFFKIGEISARKNIIPIDINNNTEDILCLNEDCNMTSSSSGEADGIAVKINTTQPHSGIKIDVGTVDPNKQYILRMQVSTNKELTANMVLRHKGHPWTNISESYTFQLNPLEKNIEKAFSFPDEAETGAVVFTVEDEQGSFSLSNIEWAEADITVEKQEYTFLYNNTSKPTTIKLSKNFYDVFQKPINGEITLDPFSSKILFP